MPGTIGPSAGVGTHTELGEGVVTGYVHRWRRRVVAVALVGAGVASVAALGTAPPADAAQRTTSVKYSCSSALGSLILVVKVAGVTPGSVPTDAKVEMASAQVAVTIPAAYVNKVIAYTHAKSASGKTSKLDFVSTNADRATVNAAKTPIAFGPVALVKNKAAVLEVPASPTSVGAWVAADTGGLVMTFSPGLVVITIKVGSFSGTATCKPTKTVAISTTAVV